jgi:hypothetical protein
MKQKLCVSAFENKKKEADLSDFSDSWRRKCQQVIRN